METLDFGLEEFVKVQTCDWCKRQIQQSIRAFDGRTLCPEKDSECWKLGIRMSRVVRGGV